ncbi:MAG: anti-sigma factor [Acidimicrobiia bacterium]|nr:anti-sigma factor [Acidimicrobiia bacterium]
MSDLHDLAAPYVLGALTAAELAAFEEHLDGCQSCQVEVRTLSEGADAIAMAVAESPPAHMRESILTQIGAGSAVTRSTVSSRPLSRSILLPAAAVAVVVIGVLAVFGRGDIGRVLDAPDAVAVDLVATADYPGQPPSVARVVFSPAREQAVVELEGLPTLDPGRTYQLWLIGAEGPVPAGTFNSTGGSAVVLLDGSPSVGLVVGITEEPREGSPAPTGPVLLSAEL